MGEVYLALDTRLNRKVALKILPVALASNTDRMRRFNQEASAAAALNHSVIACGITRRVLGYRQVLALRVADGAEQPITSKQWAGPGVQNMRLSWLVDNSGILVSGAETGSLSQIWHLAWPGDEARNVTDFLNDYAEISLTANSETLSAVVSDRVINLWTARDGDITNARKITSGADRADGERGISWTPDSKLAYYSTAGGHQNIWMMESSSEFFAEFIGPCCSRFRSQSTDWRRPINH
jgi:hypothetical protein